MAIEWEPLQSVNGLLLEWNFPLNEPNIGKPNRFSGYPQHDSEAVREIGITRKVAARRTYRGLSDPFHNFLKFS